MNFFDVWWRKIRVRYGDRYDDHIQAPSIPRWGYQPTGPFQLLRFNPQDASVLTGYEDEPTLDEVLASFVRLHLPRLGESCYILDRDHQVVLSWATTDAGIEWAGCAQAFLELERHHDPMDVWMWRAAAEATAMLALSEVPHDG